MSVLTLALSDTRHQLRGVSDKSWVLILKAGAADPKQQAGYCPGDSPGFQEPLWSNSFSQQSAQCPNLSRALGAGSTWSCSFRDAVCCKGFGAAPSIRGSAWVGKRLPLKREEAAKAGTARLLRQGCGARATRWGPHVDVGPDEGVEVGCDAKDWNEMKELREASEHPQQKLMETTNQFLCRCL